MKKSFWGVLPLVLSPCFAQPPVIADNGVLDAASYTADLAQGGLFVVRGAHLGAAGTHSAGQPLPTTLAGASIRFASVAGGPAADALMVSAQNDEAGGQLMGVLPGTLAPGAYS